MKLLWINDNPNGSFSAQNINLDYSQYDELQIVHTNGITLTVPTNTEITSTLTAAYQMSGSSGAIGYHFRIYTLRTSAIGVSDNKLNNEQQHDLLFNNVNIPYKIYGIKNIVN